MAPRSFPKAVKKLTVTPDEKGRAPMGDPMVGRVCITQGDEGGIWITAHTQDHTHLSCPCKIDIPYFRESDLSILLTVLTGGMSMVTKERTEQFKAHFLATVSAALKKSGVSGRQASIAVVGHDGLIRDIRAGRLPSPEKIDALCEFLGIDFYIGPPRQPADAPTIDPTDNLDYALVAAYPVEASAGPGATAVDVASDGALAFRKEWLSRRGISVDNAALLRARGDSMQPVIWHGDLIMIDRSRTVPRIRDPKAVSLRKGYQDDIYVVELEGSLLVKALRRPSEHRLIIFSENTAHYDPVELRDEEINALRVVGKAVWWGHSAD